MPDGSIDLEKEVPRETIRWSSGALATGISALVSARGMDGVLRAGPDSEGSLTVCREREQPFWRARARSAICERSPQVPVPHGGRMHVASLRDIREDARGLPVSVLSCVESEHPFYCASGALYRLLCSFGEVLLHLMPGYADVGAEK